MNVRPNDPGILRAIADGRVVVSTPAPLSKAKRRSKFGAVKTVVDGIRFPSLKESRCYAGLKLLQSAGCISELKLQVPFKMIHDGQLICKYIADFTYLVNGSLVVVDAKGFKTPMYRLKKKMMKIFHGIEIQET